MSVLLLVVKFSIGLYYIGSVHVMVSMIASKAVDRGFKPPWGQTKNHKICICFFSTKHAALRSKSKDWLAWKQNNVSEWSDMSTVVSVSWHYKNPTKRVSLVQSRRHYHLIKCNCSCHDMAEKLLIWS